jgi:hypothetical protein
MDHLDKAAASIYWVLSGVAGALISFRAHAGISPELGGVFCHGSSVWSAIGSSNFDHRSVLFNDEVDAIVLGTDTARDLEVRFEEDRKVAKEIDLEVWRKRPLPDRIGDFIQRTGEFLF